MLFKLFLYFLNFFFLNKLNIIIDYTFLHNYDLKFICGGENGIRTHERISPLHAFQACAFNHSATSPNHFYKNT